MIMATFHWFVRARGRLACAGAALLAVLMLGLGPARPVSPAPDPELAAEIDALLQGERSDLAFWGLHIRDLETGQVLYARNADKSFLPASNQKIFTVATAIGVLGSTYRYETALTFDGTVEDSVMTGDLVIRGSGDPTFGSREVRGRDPLERWASELASMGVRRIEGRLIGDDNVFDDQPYSEGWDVDYLTRQAGRQMGISAGGLSYSDNVVAVRIEATTPGQPPQITTRPAGVVQIENRAETSARRRGPDVVVNRTFQSNRIVVAGTVPRVYRGIKEVPVSNPTTFTLQAFRNALHAAGIETELEVADIDAVDARPAGDAPPLFVSLSPPLAEIAAIVNKESNNFYAEQLFRTYGWGGASRGGSRRTESFLARAGVDVRSVQVRDGSGLSRKDLTTPAAMGELLAYMDQHPEREAFLAAFPHGGERGTTLEYRMRNVPVQAKTGSLQFIRALSGYATRPNGQRVAFAFFANNYTGPSYRVTNVFDRIVRMLTSTTAS